MLAAHYLVPNGRFTASLWSCRTATAVDEGGPVGWYSKCHTNSAHCSAQCTLRGHALLADFTEPPL